jgi:iron complex outermembrane receptor protein
MKHLIRLSIVLACLCLTCSLSAQTVSITGQVIDSETGQAIPGVNVYSGDRGTATDAAGEFTLIIEPGRSITFAHIGYETVTLIPREERITVRMTPKILKGEPVLVRAIRAVEGVTPVAFSTLTPEEIEMRYTVEDVPMVLAQEPGVYAYSESGNGTGYSYVSIRGFDQSRIAVMLDNVPLNDNESHQVYWVDHGDILSDARDVQIQRGVGSSLYGSTAFGGSINVVTAIASDEPSVSATLGYGSYNTSKLRLKVQSGDRLGDNLSFMSRFSMVESDGYREFHESKQRALSMGLEHRRGRLTNQFRALVGYENTHLAWDGVYVDDIRDRKKRRQGYQAYTDDFLQQIYSVNTRFRYREGWFLDNVAYLVRGAGYYEVFKSDRDFYSYNLDVNDEYPDSVELQMTTDLLRRKWIVNTYYGFIPTMTLVRPAFRLDVGAEIRWYQGHHYGEVTDFSNPDLRETIGDRWYKYYDYTGRKSLATGFLHLALQPLEKLRLIGDIQYQSIRWNLDQETIGHAAGHRITANWGFLNPRMGAVYSLTSDLSLFFHYGKAQKEPADDQIINADDVWSEPVMAAAEVINDYELGVNLRREKMHAAVNLYRIDYANEQLKNIDVEQEGEYEYYSAEGTLHQGLEFEITLRPHSRFRFGGNGSFSQFLFVSGDVKDKRLPNAPDRLLNGWIRYQVSRSLSLFLTLRHVGKQYLAPDNVGEIDPYTLLDLGVRWTWRGLELNLKVNNLLDTLYSTYGYDWGGYYYYWPGATRNAYASVSYTL